MKPVCVKCHRFYSPKKNGIYFIEGMPTEAYAEPGMDEPEKWKPYKIWSGDLWECRGCGSHIIVGCGMKPLMVHHEEGFQEKIKDLDITFQVNDC